jgi:hypothetical protein
MQLIAGTFLNNDKAIVTFCAKAWKFQNAVKVSKPLGRPRRRWEDNIKMYLQEVGWGHGRD